MNIPAKKVKQQAGRLALLFVFFIVAAKVQAKATTDTAMAAKEIVSIMNNSADEWNEGRLDAFIDLYDASATMMSRCLFPDTKKQYPSHQGWRLYLNRPRLERISERNEGNAN